MFQYLNKHPEIFLSPIKEPNYFAKDIDPKQLRPDFYRELNAALKRFRKSNGTIQLHIAHIVELQEYLALFKKSRACKIVGECSVSYLSSTVAANEISSFNPDAKILIMLRNPIWRALSQYQMDRKIGAISCDFNTAIQKDLAVEKPLWGKNRNYVWNGMYADQVKRYIKLFPSKQIHILLFEDFKCKTNQEIRRVFSFLDVEENISFQAEEQFNKSGQPRVPGLNRLIHVSGIKPLLKNMFPDFVFKRIKHWYYRESKLPELSEEQVIFLCNLYRDDVRLLSKILGRDLTSWVDPDTVLSEINSVS